MQRTIASACGVGEQTGQVQTLVREFTVANKAPVEGRVFAAEFFGAFGYGFSGMPDGEYLVELGMCEGCFRAAGQRVFDVLINGVERLRKFDIFKEAGGQGLAVERTFTVRPRDGRIGIRFVPRKDNVSLSRLRIYDARGALVVEDSVTHYLAAITSANPCDKSITLHAIGNAHLDPIWQWRWTEGCAEVMATMRSALDRMNEYPEFKFSCSSALYFFWIEKMDPEMLEEIRARVAGGRWEVVGGWWVQPDCNIPAGESFCRQGLYGQRTFERLLGRRASAGYNVDSFGHAGTLPAILAQSGLDGYIVGRPSTLDRSLPADQFWWQAPDGSRVLACRLSSYNNEPISDASLASVLAMDYPSRHRPFFYGVGNHGGGPTKRAIEKLGELQKSEAWPTVRLSTVGALLQGIRETGAKLPVEADELQHFAPGCYTTHSACKRLNRQAEAALMTAERFASVAGVRAAPRQIETLWQELLTWQFHDSMGGTCLFDAQQDMLMTLGGTVQSAERLLNLAVRKLAAQVDTRGAGLPFFVFNPLPWPRRELFRTHFFSGALEGGVLPSAGVVADQEGRLLPTNFRACDGVTYVGFMADVPALGYRLYRFLPGQAGPTETDLEVDAEDLSLGNGSLAFRVDGRSGALTELLSRAAGVNLCADRGNVGVVLEDLGDAWGTGIERWDRRIGQFEAESVAVTENGPAAATIRVVSRYDRSKLLLDFTLGAGCGQVDVNLRLDWQAPRRMLKLVFPLALAGSRLTSEAPYGCQSRPLTGMEEYCQQWIDLSGTTAAGPAGLALLNNAKYGFDASDSTLRLTVCRSPLYVGSQDRCVDIGPQEFRYQLLPHAGSWAAAQVPRRAYELNQPLFVVYDHNHAGRLPPVNSLASLESPSILMTVLKKAEAGEGTVVRCYESAGEQAEGLLRLPALGGPWNIRLKPHEIATFKIPAGDDRELERIDILEENPNHESNDRATAAGRLRTAVGGAGG